MTHTPAVDSLEQVIADLTQPRTLSQFAGPNTMALVLVQEREAIAERLTALTRPPGGIERLREALIARRSMFCGAMPLATVVDDAKLNSAIEEIDYMLGMLADQRLASPQGAEQRQEDMTTCGHSKYDPCRNCEPAATQGDAPHPALGALPAPITNPEAWPPNYADGWNDCSQIAFDSMKAALSSPPGVQAAQVSDAVRLALSALHDIYDTGDGPCTADKHRWCVMRSRRAIGQLTAAIGSAAHGGEDS